MMNKETKILLATFSILWGAVCVISYNAKEATTEKVGEPYVSTFTYCDQWQGTGKTHSCIHMGTGKETRQDTINHGPLWDYEGYKVVR